MSLGKGNKNKNIDLSHGYLSYGTESTLYNCQGFGHAELKYNVTVVL